MTKILADFWAVVWRCLANHQWWCSLLQWPLGQILTQASAAAVCHEWTELRILIVQGESLCQGWDWGARGYPRVPSLCQDGIWCWHHSAVDAATSAVDVGECWQGFSCGSSPGVCGQSQTQRVFRRRMCGSVHSRKRQPGVRVRCWHTAARSLSGLCWQRLSVVRLGEELHRFQSLMRLPVWWLVWWRQSTWEQCPCRWRLWRSRKPSVGSCSTQMARPSWSELSEGQFGLQVWR